MKLFKGKSKEEQAATGAAPGIGGTPLDDKQRAEMLKVVMSAPGNEKMFREMGIQIPQEQRQPLEQPYPGEIPPYERPDEATQKAVLEALGVLPTSEGVKTSGSHAPRSGGQVMMVPSAAIGGGSGGTSADLSTVQQEALAAHIVQQMMLQLPSATAGVGVGNGRKGDDSAIGDPLGSIASLLQSIAGAHMGSLMEDIDPAKPKFPVCKAPLKQQMSKTSFQRIKLDCKGGRWSDEDFSPKYNEHVKRWCRPEDIAASDFAPVKPGSKWYLWREGKPSTKDVRQGILGDCWLLSALAALAEYRSGHFVKKLFPGQAALCQEGVYLVRLCLGGRWREILVDDRIPCVGGDPPYGTHAAYAHTVKQQLWVSMVEKALAKVCGSYEALSGGDASEALTIFTGWPCKIIFVKSNDSDADQVWSDLLAAKKNNFLLTCTTRRETRQMTELGLEPQHVYSLLDLCQVSDTKGRKVRLLKMRNPQGEGADKMWCGAWSQKSKLWTGKAREALDYYDDSDEGLFFISWPDFVTFYDHCSICRIRSKEWKETRVVLQLPKEVPPQTGVAIVVDETTDCSVVLQQAEKRMRYGPLYKGSFEPMACIGMVVMRDDEQSPQTLGIAEPIIVARMRHRQYVYGEATLEPGRYFVVPLAMTRSCIREVVVACHCSKAAKFLKSTKLDPSVVRRAWASYAKYCAEGESQEDIKRFQCKGGEMTIMQGDGASVVALVENTGSSLLQVHLGIASPGLRYARGMAETMDCVPAGHAMIVQVALPSVEETMAKFMCTPRMVPAVIIPAPPHHTPDFNRQGGFLHEPFRIMEENIQKEWEEQQSNRRRMIDMIKAMEEAKRNAEASAAAANADSTVVIEDVTDTGDEDVFSKPLHIEMDDPPDDSRLRAPADFRPGGHFFPVSQARTKCRLAVPANSKQDRSGLFGFCTAVQKETDVDG